MAYLSRAKLEFEAFCYFITYTSLQPNSSARLVAIEKLGRGNIGPDHVQVNCG